MSDLAQAIFWEIHSGLTREAPGDARSTRQAFSLMSDLPIRPKILDIGCGPGSQTLVLAALADSEITAPEITAVDTHQSYLDELTRRATERGLSDRITTANADMHALDFPDGSFDVLWAEGSIYIIGFEDGLKRWRRLLKAGGYLAATEVSWLKTNPPAEVLDFWENAYPGMQTVEGNLDIIRRAGYDVVDSFALPGSAWWDEYYNPIEEKLRALREKYADDEAALAVIATEQAEIDLYRNYGDYYGYVFYVMRVGETL